MVAHMLFAATQALALGAGVLRAPSASLSARGLLARHAAARPAMVSLPFGSSGGAEPAGPSEETLAAYRLMGLDLDATYDDIERAFDLLVAEAAGDAKRKIKLQVAKDKILDDRLRQRMAGGLKSFKTVVDPFDRPEGPKPLITIPPFLQGVMELPDKDTLIKNVVVFGIIGMLPVITTSWAPTSISLGFAVSLWLLYNRGVEQSGDMGAEMRPPKPKPLIMAVGITLLSAGICATLSQFFSGIILRIFRFLTQEALIGTGAAFGFFVAATLFKVQDDY